MLIKAIPYEDFNGEKKTKNFYFHLSKFEITKMQFQEDGGIRNYLKKMIESNDTKEIFNFLKNSFWLAMARDLQMVKNFLNPMRSDRNFSAIRHMMYL